MFPCCDLSAQPHGSGDGCIVCDASAGLRRALPNALYLSNVLPLSREVSPFSSARIRRFGVDRCDPRHRPNSEKTHDSKNTFLKARSRLVYRGASHWDCSIKSVHLVMVSDGFHRHSPQRDGLGRPSYVGAATPHCDHQKVSGGGCQAVPKRHTERSLQRYAGRHQPAGSRAEIELGIVQYGG